MIYQEPQIILQRAACGSRAAGWAPLLYNVIALFTIPSGSECWTIKAQSKLTMLIAVIQFMRKSLGYNWTDYKININMIKAKFKPFSFYRL